MSEMVERVAESMRLRAIERGQPIHPTMAHHLAAAAIEAMREPTKEIRRVGVDPEMADGYWRLMIDAVIQSASK